MVQLNDYKNTIMVMHTNTLYHIYTPTSLPTTSKSRSIIEKIIPDSFDFSDNCEKYNHVTNTPSELLGTPASAGSWTGDILVTAPFITTQYMKAPSHIFVESIFKYVPSYRSLARMA